MIFRLILPLIVIVVFLMIVKYIMDHRNVDRPQRIGRKEAARVLEENRVLRQTLNALDAEARADYALTERPLGAVISNKITEARNSLD